MRVEGYNVPLTVVKSDGGFTYDTTDLAAVYYRLGLGMDSIIYVVDNGQTDHFSMIFKVAEKMGWKKKDQVLRHVGFGVVLGEDGKKFKSRSGDTVKLADLLDDAIVNAKKVLEEHRENTPSHLISNETQIVENIAYSSLKYADLASMRTNDYKFSFGKMLSLKGNTGAYQLYEYVRICSILRKVKGLIHCKGTETELEAPEELALCRRLVQLPEIINSVEDTLMFHTLCSYLYELTSAFSQFHTNCRCLNFDSEGNLVTVNETRIDLCYVTQRVMKYCFDILGIKTVEKM